MPKTPKRWWGLAGLAWGGHLLATPWSWQSLSEIVGAAPQVGRRPADRTGLGVGQPSQHLGSSGRVNCVNDLFVKAVGVTMPGAAWMRTK